MITFLDGPAAGTTLQLRRLPKLLRVVIDGTDVDALDQLEDKPKARESVYVYVRRDDMPISKYHLYCGSSSKRSGWYYTASYSFLAEQPQDADMRTTAAWQKWADSQFEAIKTLYPPPANSDAADGGS
jgi:hypothetical protein